MLGVKVQEMVSEEVQDLLFKQARTHFKWLPREVDEETLHQLYELLRWAPTSANSNPLRIKFIRSKVAKSKLEPQLSAGNVVKTMTAPVTAIVGYDLNFYKHLPRLFAHDEGIYKVFSNPENSEHAESTAFLNACLQGGYMILAARMLGLDCGPMSGFNKSGVDNEFWQGQAVKTIFLCNLGYGDHSVLFPRLPRLSFDDACSII